MVRMLRMKVDKPNLKKIKNKVKIHLTEKEI